MTDIEEGVLGRGERARLLLKAKSAGSLSNPIHEVTSTEAAADEIQRKIMLRRKVRNTFRLPLTFKRPSPKISNTTELIAKINYDDEDKEEAIPPELTKYQSNRDKSHFLVVDFNKSQIQARSGEDLTKLARPEWSSVRWIHVDSMDPNMLKHLRSHLPARISIKDILRKTTKSRVEEHEQYLFFTFQLIAASLDIKSNSTHQIKTIRLNAFMFLEEDIIVTITENDQTPLASQLLLRLSKGGSRMRNSDTSYILYYLIKFTLTPLQKILDYHERYMEQMEDKITFQDLAFTSFKTVFHEIHEIRRELQQLKQRIVNLAETIDDIRDITERDILDRHVLEKHNKQSESSSSLHKSASFGSQLSDEAVGIFPNNIQLARVLRLQFKHLSNSTNTMLSQVSTLQEICSWLADLVYQTLSQKMNQIMKTLTVISCVFIPLTFIVGVYGTNFIHFPELQWQFGYLYLWCLCLSVVAIELVVFKYIKWL
eukprot:TRINITY_DN9668_c0_g1_i1.p1 TRINITY_DN9668_c0_g1~~TRINITY_DN9668_c0_g1_i1.p1  ORF type:complete len:484 (+),score=92.80 TRINITY_DN9668_c0_g1_i1:47-1498(+)